MWRLVFSLMVSLCVVASVTAGDWTAEQQEVLDHVQGCWDGWERSVAEGNHDIWVKACRPDPEIVWWWQGDGMPQDLDAYQRMTKWELETQERVIYSDFRPISVKIHGSTAIVANYGYAAWIDKNGKRIVTQDQRLSVLQKKSEGWTFIAEMVIGVTAAPDWIAQSVRD
jgi:hypothetical protein